MTENVLISITGLHAAAGNPEEDIEIVFPGQYRLVGSTHCVRYEETSEGGGLTRSTILIRPDLVEAIRKGEIETRMVFDPNKRSQTYYATEYGKVSLGISAVTLKVEIMDEMIRADVNYALDMNGSFVSDCEIMIRVVPSHVNGIRLTGLG